MRSTSASSSVGTNAIHSAASVVRTGTSTGPGSAPNGSPSSAPVSARNGSLSSAILTPFPRLLLTPVESEQVPSEVPRSVSSVTASPSAVWQCSFERSHEHWSQLCDSATSIVVNRIAQLVSLILSESHLPVKAPRSVSNVTASPSVLYKC
jgi:hypothetical protein